MDIKTNAEVLHRAYSEMAENCLGQAAEAMRIKDQLKNEIKKILEACGYSRSSLADVYAKHTGDSPSILSKILILEKDQLDIDVLEAMLAFALKNPTQKSVFYVA